MVPQVTNSKKPDAKRPHSGISRGPSTPSPEALGIGQKLPRPQLVSQGGDGMQPPRCAVADPRRSPVDLRRRNGEGVEGLSAGLRRWGLDGLSCKSASGCFSFMSPLDFAGSPQENADFSCECEQCACRLAGWRLS